MGPKLKRLDSVVIAGACFGDTVWLFAYLNLACSLCDPRLSSKRSGASGSRIDESSMNCL